MINPFKKINERITELEDVLTRNIDNPTDYIGSRIDGKVEQRDFDDLKQYFKDYKDKVIGKRKVGGYSTINSFWYSSLAGMNIEVKDKTLFDEIDEIKESIKKIEEFLGIERKQTESKTDKYVRKEIKKKK